MFKWMGDEIANQADQALQEEKGKKDNYHAYCPQCGKKQLRDSLLENGCFVCGWKGSEEDIELSDAKYQSEIEKNKANDSDNLPYKINCPQCGVGVIAEEFQKNGCWRCGYKQ